MSAKLAANWKAAKTPVESLVAMVIISCLLNPFPSSLPKKKDFDNFPIILGIFFAENYNEWFLIKIDNSDLLECISLNFEIGN